MDSTSFLATHIHRIARRRLTGSAIWLGVMTILACVSCLLGLVSADSDSDIIMLFLCTTILGVGVGGWSLWNVIRYLRAVRNPAQSLWVIGFKSAEGLDKVVALIDGEAAPYAGRLGAFVTKHLVISVELGSLSLLTLDELVWVYKTRVGLLPKWQGKPYAAVLWSRHSPTRYGKYLSVTGTEEQVDRLLQEVIKAAPWVEQGWSQAKVDDWWKQRALFIASVDRRREGQVAFQEAYPNATPPAAPLDLNDPANERIRKLVNAAKDRRYRFIGAFLLILGIVFLLLPIGYFAGRTAAMSAESAFLNLWLSLFLIALSAGLIFFGHKAEDYMENNLFKHGWRTAIFVILLTLSFFACAWGGPALLKALGLLP